MHTPLCEPVVHTGTSLSVLRSPSETNRVSDCRSSIVKTPSSKRILDKPKIEVTKVLLHYVGKNGEHFHGENFIFEYSTKRHIKSNQHMDILHEFSNCVRETFNHGLSPSEVDWDDPKGEPTKMLKHTSSGNMLMEVDWGGNLKNNYVSSGSMLKKVDWGGKLIDTIYIKTQVFRLLRYYSPEPRNIARSDWATQNITHNMTSSIIQPYGLHSL